MAQAQAPDEYTQQILLLLNDERRMPLVFDYTPSDELHEKLYNMIRSAAGTGFAISKLFCTMPEMSFRIWEQFFSKYC